MPSSFFFFAYGRVFAFGRAVAFKRAVALRRVFSYCGRGVLFPFREYGVLRRPAEQRGDGDLLDPSSTQTSVSLRSFSWTLGPAAGTFFFGTLFYLRQQTFLPGCNCAAGVALFRGVLVLSCLFLRGHAARRFVGVLCGECLLRFVDSFSCRRLAQLFFIV